jgi:tetratricopeptide (TPR) repeat protein
MNSVCPVCLKPDQAEVCTHCGTNLARLTQIRLLENIADQRNTLPTLQEVLRLYREMKRPQAATRILSRLANYFLRVGRWREARLYLEHILSLGEAAGSPAFRASVQRDLGGLLGRQGELPLALHLLAQAEKNGDPLALVEKLRLEIDSHSKVNVLLTVSQVGNAEDLPRLAKAWRLEASVRYFTISDENELTALVQEAEAAKDSYSEAIARRALALWQTNHAQNAAAVLNLRTAIQLFLKESDVYEVARTQVDVARACLLTDGGVSIAEKPEASNEHMSSIATAQGYLGSAITLFHKLGAVNMKATAQEVLNSLAIGRQTAPLKPDSTSAGVVILWVSMDGKWEESFWAQAIATAHQQGGLAERMLGGMVVIFGEEQHHGDNRLALETALALHELIGHHSAYNLLDSSSRFRMVAALGMLPLDEADVTSTLRSLPRSRLFQETRTQAARIDAGTICLNDMLYLSTQEHYRFEPLKSEPSDDSQRDPRWWVLKLPQHDPVIQATPSRYELTGLDRVLPALDRVLDKFKQQQLGGLIAISGQQGTGKTRLLNTLIGELQKSMKLWIIHLRGRDAIRYQPFGVIQHWLGSAREVDPRPPEERRQDTIAGFRRSVTGLLKSKPLLLVIDDVHLMDSGSLEALKAVLPLTASHKLLVMVAARPGDPAYALPFTWDSLVDLSIRALPERTLSVSLPEKLAYQSRELPGDWITKHVLACAAVLGDRFSVVTLRRISGVPTLTPHLKELRVANILVPTARSMTWQFAQTAERDAIYQSLTPEYRAILHWYARQALKDLGMYADDHIHPAGLPEPALKISVRAAQQALEMDSPAEALLHFDHALGHYEGEGLPVDLLLGRAGVLLSLDNWMDVQEIISKLQQQPDLSPRDQATLLVYQGELNYRVGEVAMLFRLYQQAADKLRELPEEEADLSEQIGMLYAQALARYKRGELEIARSLIGTALHMAQQADLDHELAHLWELLARIHHQRGELEAGLKAIQHTLNSYREMKYRFSLLEPLERAGALYLDSGEVDKARQHLSEALAIADEVGQYEGLVRLHSLLAKTNLYRGEFAEMTSHLEAALNHARYLDHPVLQVRAHAAYAEALTLAGRGVLAMQQATLAMQLAGRHDEPATQAAANLALTQVALALKQLEDAEAALGRARTAARGTEVMLDLFRVELVAMEFAAAKGDNEAFNQAYLTVRDLPTRGETEFLRARIDLLRGQQFMNRKEWNEAAREAERAARAFQRLGATYWHNQAQRVLKLCLPHVTGEHTYLVPRPPLPPAPAQSGN